MNNEPVAYRHLHKDGWEYYDAPTGEDCKDCIPLYTHPAKTLTDDPLVNFKPIWQEKPELTLTDEEIMVLYEEYIETQYASESNVLGFGRAILRKAQEK